MKSRMIKALIAAVAILAVIGGTIVLAEPGDTDDPVVTKSYIVDVVVPQLKAYVCLLYTSRCVYETGTTEML